MSDTLTTPLQLIREIRRELDCNILPCLTAPARIRDLRMAIDMLDYALIWLQDVSANAPLQREQLDLLKRLRTVLPVIGELPVTVELQPFPPLAPAAKAQGDAEAEARLASIDALTEAPSEQRLLALQCIRLEQTWMEHELSQLGQRQQQAALERQPIEQAVVSQITSLDTSLIFSDYPAGESSGERD